MQKPELQLCMQNVQKRKKQVQETQELQKVHKIKEVQEMHQQPGTTEATTEDSGTHNFTEAQMFMHEQ